MALPCPVRPWADNIHELSPSPPRALPMQSTPPRGPSLPPLARQDLQPVAEDQGTSGPQLPWGRLPAGPRGVGGRAQGKGQFLQRLSWARLDLPGFP